MNAQGILSLLHARHSQDIFIDECKNGSSYNGHLRLDAWVMKPSWSNPLTIGYEIKTSRSDFLNDNKWMGYLAYCNEFYFVCPWGMIKPEELSSQCGLMWVSQNNNRLYIKKKSPYRDVKIEEDFYRYIIMCRCKIIENGRSYNRIKENKSNKELAEEFIKEKSYDKILGINLSKTLKEVINKEIELVRKENKELETRNLELQGAKELLEKIGVYNEEGWRKVNMYALKTKIEETNKLVPVGLKNQMKNLKQVLDNILNMVENNDK